MSFAHAIIHAQVALMPLVYVSVSAQFGLTAASIGAIIAITDLVGGFSQIAYGTLVARVSRVRVLAVGYVVLGISLVLVGLSQGPRQFVIALAGARLGGSPQHPLGTALISDHVTPSRRGLAISAHTAGANLGAVAIPILGAWMIALAGWNVTLALFAIPALVMGLVVPILIREVPVARPAQSSAAPPRRWSFARRRELATLIAVATIVAGGRGLLIAPFVLLYLGGPLGYAHGVVSVLYTLLLVGSVVGPLLAGYLSDRHGRRKVAILYYLASAGGVLLFFAAGTNLIALIIALVPFGMAVFSESPILQAILADRTEPGERDSAFSLFFAITFGVGALWAVILGGIIHIAGFGAGFTLMAASYLVAALIMSTMPANPLATQKRKEAADGPA